MAIEHSAMNPKDVRFTATSILVSFETSPLKHMHIDNIVDLLLSENWPSCNCPILPIIRCKNTLWTLQNQWLWVYRKAKFPVVDTLVLDPASEHPESFLANAKIPDVACFLTLLKKPHQMARMKSELFFPTVKGHWQIQHSEELIDAMRIRQNFNHYDRSMHTTHPVTKFGPSADSQAGSFAGLSLPHRVHTPASIETDSLLAANTVSTSSSTLQDLFRSETYAAESAMLVLERLAAPRQGRFPLTNCYVAASCSNQRRLPHESKPFTTISTTAVVRTSPPVAQATDVRSDHLPGPLTRKTSTGVTRPWKPDNCRQGAPETQNAKPLPPRKSTFVDDEHYSEAILAAMSVATMHGLTFTIPVPNSAAFSSTTINDAPVATFTGCYVPQCQRGAI